MKTKKNTKYSHNLDNPIADFLVVSLTFLVIFFSLFLIYKNLNKTFERKDKTPVAYVVRKYKTVQRKLLDRAVWDRPVQSTVIYNGDTIRTESDASVSIRFFEEFGESTIDLGSDTIIQLFKPEGKNETSVKVSGGKVSVQTAGSKVVVKSDNASITVEKDSILHADKKTEDFFSASVEKGEASVEKTEAEIETNTKTEVLKEGNVLTAGKSFSITMISPSSSARILNRSNDKKSVPVTFKWKSSFPETEELILETSPNRKFSKNILKYKVKGLNEFTLEQNNGKIYWRLYSAEKGAEDNSTASGRLEIAEAPAPVLLEPQENAEYIYKNDYPPVRFLWKGNALAVSYLFEVSDNPKMENPKISRIVSTSALTLSQFSEGTWYWRVVPVYQDNNEAAEDYGVSSFSVLKNAKAIPIELLLPKAIADTAEGKPLRFLWKNISEANKYRLKVCANQNMENPIIDEIITSNYFELGTSFKKLPNGNYYWNVEGLDKNGITSALSSVKEFKTLDEGLVLRSIFPPDGYSLAEPLCKDTRFTFKTNIDGTKYFQVSASEDFKELAANIKTDGTAAEGAVLKPGVWYWRVVTEINEEQLKSSTKKLIIVPPLQKPELIDAEKNTIIMPKGKNKFKWTAVEGAEYYQVKIRENTLNSKPFYENLNIKETEVEMFLQSVEDGSYIMSIQGFAEASASSSRRYGFAEDFHFNFKHLKAAELLEPADGAALQGMQAALKPGILKWTSVEIPAKSKLVLEKRGKKTPVLSIDNPGFTVQLPPLEAGKYTWKIIGETKGGFNISSKKHSSFTVLPIPPLEAVGFTSPKPDSVLDVKFFKTHNSIKFSWSKNKDATHYSVIIYNAGRKPVFKKDIPANMAGDNIIMDFKEFSLLSRGTFFIEVKAQRRLQNGVIFQDGKISKRKFIIDLPKTQKIKTNETGVMYGL